MSPETQQLEASISALEAQRGSLGDAVVDAAVAALRAKLAALANPPAPLAVKGVDAPVRSDVVTHAKPRSSRIGTCGVVGVATRMIGRDAERGMDGMELAGAIHQVAPKLQRVLFSSLGRKEAGDTEGRFSAYLNKPLRQSQLFDTLATLLVGRAPKAAKAVKPRLDAGVAQRHPLRILLAQDTAVNQKLALRLLQQMGCRVAMAANGMQGDRGPCPTADMDEYVSTPIRVDAPLDLLPCAAQRGFA